MTHYDDYYLRKANEAKIESAGFAILTEDEKISMWKTTWADSVEQWLKYKKKCNTIAFRYNCLLDLINNWDATETQKRFKDFMVEQINLSNSYSDYYNLDSMPKLEEFSVWVERHEREFCEDIQRYTNRHNDALKKATEYRQFEKDIRDSLQKYQITLDSSVD